MFGGVEAGGTKFVCDVGTSPDDLEHVVLPTTTPRETIRDAIEFLRSRAANTGPLHSIGIASFGPVDLKPHSPTYGWITSTPKEGWRNVNITGEFQQALGIPVAFDTDVNGAALAESRWGAAKDLSTVVYITVGTGIGGGALVRGRPVHGLLHPEMGHVLIPHDRSRDPFGGSCPFHGDCWEGLASGTAIAQRWGLGKEPLPSEHCGWELEADNLAAGLAAIVCILSPERIIVGGGVTQNKNLLPLVRQKLALRLNGYLQTPAILDHMESYVVPPALGGLAGVLGAIALAADGSSHCG